MVTELQYILKKKSALKSQAIFIGFFYLDIWYWIPCHKEGLYLREEMFETDGQKLSKWPLVIIILIEHVSHPGLVLFMSFMVKTSV